MAQLALTLFGPFQARLDGVPIAGFESQKVRALLVYLALEAGGPHPREALAGLFWPEQADQDARTNLRQALANLRQALGGQQATPPYVRISGATLQFNRASDHQLDVAAFTALLAACDRHPHRHLESCTSCARRLEQAAEIYQGDFLSAFFLADSPAFEEWALITRERLHGRALQALIQLATYHERRGAYAQAQHYARRQLELDPWREESHRQLMRLLALSGQRSAALMQYATCRRILATELGVEPEEATTAQYARILQGVAVAAAGAVPPADNLDTYVPLTPLIGREAELAQLADRLEQRDCRLLTLIGPGGIGKTRLALQAATDLRGSFRGGVAFVPLAALNGPELIVPAIASALGVTFHGPADPTSQLLAYLRTKDLLLVLDNFEHLLVVAPLVGEMLASCPDLVVLATSRAPLHLCGEQLFPVPALPLPDLAQLPDADRLTAYAAVALFIARAQAVQPAFQLTPANAVAVATICARLDGLPLAIELAAARLKLFTPAALLRGLNSRLTLLTGGAHDLSARQQTLRNTIDWSYDLLTAGEQRLFRCLAVFVGGCTLEAITAVCSPHSTLPMDVVDGITRLLDQSLLRQTEDGSGEPRFTMLETIREYARERLAESAEQAEIQSRHAEYFVALVERINAEGGEWEHWDTRTQIEYANLRDVLSWSRTAGPGGAPATDIGMRLAQALRQYWAQGDQQEGLFWLRELCGPAWHHGPAHLRARLLSSLGQYLSFSFYPQDRRQAPAILDQSLHLSRELGDLWALAEVCRHRGDVAFGHEDLAAAEACYIESLAAARAVASPWNIAWGQFNFGRVAVMRGEDRQAAQLYEECLAVFQELGYNEGVRVVVGHYSAVLLRLGELEQATKLLDDLLASARNDWQVSELRNIHDYRGMAAYTQSDLQRASEHFAQALRFELEAVQHFPLGNDLPMIQHLLSEIAVVVAAQGHHIRAARLLSHIPKRFYYDKPNLVQAQISQALATCQAQLDDATFAAAWSAGQALTLEQAIAEALQAAV